MFEQFIRNGRYDGFEDTFTKSDPRAKRRSPDIEDVQYEDLSDNPFNGHARKEQIVKAAREFLKEKMVHNPMFEVLITLQFLEAAEWVDSHPVPEGSCSAWIGSLIDCFSGSMLRFTDQSASTTIENELLLISVLWPSMTHGALWAIKNPNK